MDVENMVREGRVTAVDTERRIAKVWFADMKMESGWMPVLVTGAPMPSVNEQVLALYVPVFNGDGVILGGVRPWR